MPATCVYARSSTGKLASNALKTTSLPCILCSGPYLYADDLSKAFKTMVRLVRGPSKPWCVWSEGNTCIL